jgi:UPF0716 family protein affecting phage T7 exclusion
MQVHPLRLNRLFVTIVLILLTSLLGMAMAEMVLLRPLRQSIEKGMVSHSPLGWVAQKYAD